jgi:hypothetical protein
MVWRLAKREKINKEVLEEYPLFENYCMDILESHL